MYPEMHGATQSKGPTRLLAFALEGEHPLPVSSVSALELPAQPKLDVPAEVVEMGAALYGGYCKICHGSKAVARFEGSVRIFATRTPTHWKPGMPSLSVEAKR